MIRLSRLAEIDLRGIHSWIENQAGSAVAARVTEAILSGIERLEGHPASGRSGRVAGTSELVIARLPYVVIYRMTGADVIIARVLHGALAWPRR